MATLVHLPSPLAPCKMISLRQIFTLGWPSLSLSVQYSLGLFSQQERKTTTKEDIEPQTAELLSKEK